MRERVNMVIEVWEAVVYYVCDASAGGLEHLIRSADQHGGAGPRDSFHHVVRTRSTPRTRTGR